MRLLVPDPIGSETVFSEGHWVDLVEPWEAARYDPSMHEWLQLVASEKCPECGSSWFGTENPRGYLLVRRCHDEHGQGCHAKFRPEVDVQTICAVIGALSGERKRFWTVKPSTGDPVASQEVGPK